MPGPFRGLLLYVSVWGCRLLIFITSEFKLRGSGETLAIWNANYMILYDTMSHYPLFYPNWIDQIISFDIILYSIFILRVLLYCIPLYYIILCSIIFYPLGLSWVGFWLFSRSRTLFSGFDRLEKRLIHYMNYYVKVRVWGLFSAWSISRSSPLCFCLGGAVCSFLLRQNSNCEGLMRPSQFEFRYSCHYGVVWYGSV